MARKHKIRHGIQLEGGLDKCDYQDDIDYLSMSDEEVQAYLDSVEPVDPEEVDEFYQRVYPKIMDEIMEIERKSEPRRASVRIRRGIVFAICMILMLSVVAQALGIPVWSTVVEWTKEHIALRITSSGDTPSEDEPKVLSDEVRDVWGEDVFNALQEIGKAPSLPTWMPEGFALDDFAFINDGEAGAYIGAYYRGDMEGYFMLSLEILPDAEISYIKRVERDETELREYESEGTIFYLTANLERQVVTWYDENVVINISGTISEPEIMEMIKSVKKGSYLE